MKKTILLRYGFTNYIKKISRYNFRWKDKTPKELKNKHINIKDLNNLKIR